MKQLVAAEALKLRTTRAWIGYALVLLFLTAVGASGTVGTAETHRLGTTDLSREILSTASVASVVAFVIGIVSVTTEWRHGTITRTLLVTPRRGRMLVAKALFNIGLAAGLALVALLLVLAIAVPWLELEGSSLALGGLAGYAGRIVVATVLWGALGVGIGSVVHGQTVALVGGILWVLLAEGLLTALLGLVELETIGDFLPGRALSAFDGSEPGGLSMWPAAIVSVAWVVALGVAGYFRISREDVT